MEYVEININDVTFVHILCSNASLVKEGFVPQFASNGNVVIFLTSLFLTSNSDGAIHLASHSLAYYLLSIWVINPKFW